MSESQVFQLARLYYGHLVTGGARSSTTPGVIARTPDVTPTQISECLHLAKIAPPSPQETTPDMPGALAIFRGETIDFVLAKAQYNSAGVPQVLYVLTPATLLRALGGNVLALRSLALMEMTTFATVKNNLVPFELNNAIPPDRDAQAEALLDLLLFCQDSFKNVEGILAALVQGWPLAIVNAPPSVDMRLRFLQGLLCLLPIPARVGITFATHLADPASCAAQVKFTSQRVVPAQHLVYDWGQGEIVTPPPDHSYSHYMVAQLRLDPSLVVEQTEQLSRTAVWRAMHRENLGRALAWVSRRAALDQIVSDGQPADRDTVAAILREDPTLSDELRQAYVRHLLAFALALNDPDSADVIPTVCVTNQDLVKAVNEQLRAAINHKQAQTVYALLERWLLRVPEASAIPWHPVLHAAAKQHFKNLLRKQEIEPAVEFMNTLEKAAPALRMNEVIPDVVRFAVQAGRTNPQVASAVFLMAVKALPAGELRRVLGDQPFVSQLPREMQIALTYLQPEPRTPVPPHVLDQGARAFGDGHRMTVLARLVEAAMYLERPELLDTAALQGLLVMTQSASAEDYQGLIQQVVDSLSQPSAIQVLEPPGPRVLLQLLLQTRDFNGVVGMLEFYQNSVFGLERLGEFTTLAGELYRMAALAPEALNEALTVLEGSPLRPEPRAAIYCNALINRQWAPDQDYAARRLTTMIFNDHNLVSAIGQDNVLRLLDFYARSQNALDSLRVAAALIDQSLHQGTEGAALIVRMWPSITWNQAATEAAIELTKRFLRGVPVRQIPALLTYFTTQLGPAVGETLRATYLMRQVLGDMDVLQAAESVHIAAEMLTDMAVTYHTNRELPPIHRLRHDLDTMPGGLSEPERQQVAQNTLLIPRLIHEMGRERSRKKGKPPVEELLVQGQAAPQNGVDLLRFIGGYFAERQVIPINLGREEMAHLLGSRSAAMFLRETTAMAKLLTGLKAAFETQDSSATTPQALADELASLWSSLSLYQQRRTQETFARDCQQLADVMSLMADKSSDRFGSDGGAGRQLETGQRRPQTALEALRWIHGYFARKHTRSTRT